MSFPFHRQLDEMDCGPACLKMIAEYHGKLMSLQTLREKCYITREGVSLLGISEAAEGLGYRTIAVKVTYGGVAEQPGLLEFPLPCIVHWQQRHFIVVYKINAKSVWVADPAHGRLKLKRADFEASWCSDGDKGIALGLEPAPAFYHDKATDSASSKGLLSLLPYLKPYKQLLIQLGIGFLVGLLFQLLIPFLAQSLIDVGVNQGNLSFVWLVLGAQLALFVMQSAIQFLQSWILLQIGRRISVNLVADFLTKLMRLPLGFFDSKNVGDLSQRIADNDRIEGFLTGSLLSIIFAVFSLPVFSFILLSYSSWMFGVFVLAAVAYFSWILLFMRWRRNLDYLAFQQAADNQQNIYEMISGMTEIKLQGSERKRRWRWMDIQGRLFHIQSKSLALRQYQEFGASFINRLKDIIISVIAAQAVIKGEMTLGMMMAAQYIVAQLNSPFEQMIGFLRATQDARMSLERINEVTNMPDEDAADLPVAFNFSPKADLILQDVSFSYTPISPSVLSNVNLTIPQGKVTAIVGASGSGKTTLLKLLLGFYPTSSGKISIGTLPLNALNKRFWRQQCGTVMQDGFIFSDTIAANIAESAENVDFERLQQAIRIANLETYIYSLPLGLNTVIGSRGVGLSQGQRQRLLIARAVYKNPSFLFFDEATNALDANNEREIVQHLNAFFEQKTVVVVAHRLSTVRHADKIIVLDAGRIVEEGTHEELVTLRGQYYTLIQNQLELGN